MLFAASCAAGEIGVEVAVVGVARGDTARRAIALGFGFCLGVPATCFGASTTMSGSAVGPLPAGAAVCDIAAPPRPSSNDAEPERSRVLLARNVINPNPEKPRPHSSSTNSEGPAVEATDRFLVIPMDRPRMTRRSLRDDEANSVRRSGEREAERQREWSSDERTRHRWPDMKIPRPAELGAAVVLQTGPYSPWR